MPGFTFSSRSRIYDLTCSVVSFVALMSPSFGFRMVFTFQGGNVSLRDAPNIVIFEEELQEIANADAVDASMSPEASVPCFRLRKFRASSRSCVSHDSRGRSRRRYNYHHHPLRK